MSKFSSVYPPSCISYISVINFIQKSDKLKKVMKLEDKTYLSRERDWRKYWKLKHIIKSVYSLRWCKGIMGNRSLTNHYCVICCDINSLKQMYSPPRYYSQAMIIGRPLPGKQNTNFPHHLSQWQIHKKGQICLDGKLNMS